MTLRHNLFRFAPRELSHSALWAWIFQSLDATDRDDLHGVRRLASAFLDDVGAPAPQSVDVHTERVLGEAGRVDIYVEMDACLLVIENKVGAIPSAAQVQRYQEALAGDQRRVIVCLVSASFDAHVRDAVKGVSGVEYRGLSDLVRLVAPHASSHPLLRDYAAWLQALTAERDQQTANALSDDRAVVQSALATAEGQWALLEHLQPLIGARRLRRGTNMGGTPWTQLDFGDHVGYALFYRVDQSKRGAYLSLRQYESAPYPSLEGSRERLARFRTAWNRSCAEAGAELRVGQPRNGGVKECEIGVFYVAENSTRSLLEHLPAVHAAFVQQTADLVDR